MATLASSSNLESQGHNRPQKKSFARKCERCCCSTIIYFPLVFVYGLTTWAVYVQISIGFEPDTEVWTGYWSAFFALSFYILLNWSYTTAVFVDPGSPVRTAHAYRALPSHELPDPSTAALTVKSTGGARFCKKCQTKKPDRAHHCSTCRRCVLKMDHHCPWLATCVGLRNYKPFLLFLIYTCLFCWLGFAASFSWVYSEIFEEMQYRRHHMPVNYVLLAVMAGIIGLVLTGFTAWHIWLAFRGLTTIESLEKTRYLTPLKKSMQNRPPRQDTDGESPTFAEQLREIHANALPGVTRPEEGEERSSPAQTSLRLNWSEMEQLQERDRYIDYLDEKDSEKLPNAFDLGWKRNFRHVFGENTWLWWFPVCNTTGNGWNWDINSEWVEAKERLAREREARLRENEAFEQDRGIGRRQNPNASSRGSPSPYDYRNQHQARQSPLPPPPRRMPAIQQGHEDHGESIGEDAREPFLRQQRDHPTTSNWNDLPADLLTADSSSPIKSRSRSPRPRWANG